MPTIGDVFASRKGPPTLGAVFGGKYQNTMLMDGLKARVKETQKTGGGAITKPSKRLISDKLGEFIGDTLVKFGIEERHAARIGNRVTAAARDLTLAGNVDDFLYGDNDLQRQLAILPLPGPVKKEVQAAVRKGIRAWHGSPHDFDKFSLSKIGTGEGAQAYGHGLYFAENKETANAYRLALAPPGMSAGAYNLAQRAKAQAEKEGLSGLGLNRRARELLHQQSRYSGHAVQTYYDAMNNLETLLERPGGRLYEVNINANPEDFLDWDSSITDLSKASPRDRLVDDYKAAMLGRHLGETPDINSMNAELLRQGIPGIRYLDQGSRGTLGEAMTRNYVVFDDSLVDILNKY